MKFSNQILVMWLLLAMSQLSILEARAGGRSSRKVGEEIEIVGSRQILTGRDSGSADDSTTDDSTTDDSTTDDSTTDDSTTDDSTTDDSTTDDSTTDDSTTDDSTTEAPPPACPDKKPGCIDCTTKGKCDDSTGTLTPDGTCSPNEACIVVGSVPVCKPIAETTCNCGGNSQGCDPFDVNQPIYCISGKLYQADPCASGQKCSGAGECVAGSAPSNPAAACTGTKPEFRLVTPACTTGVFCAGTEVVETTKCKETEYFDLQSASCKAFPPPNPCGCGKTKCPIIMGNCTNYAVCDGNTLIDEESCIGSNNKFDFDNQACASAATGPCAPYKDCTFTSDSSDDGSSSGSSSGSATTIPPKPSTCNATNAGKRYPHETECKKYYTCREVSRDKYDYVNGKCIGKLVFNPANSYCDLVGNVLGCQT